MTAPSRSLSTRLPASIDRRLLLGGSAVAALAAMGSGGAVFAQGKHVHPETAKSPGQAHGRHGALIAALKACISKGEACVKHCIALLNKGDTSLVDCLKTTTAMLPICRALERYAAIDAKHLRELAQLCVVVNQECEAECQKHADHHTACRECADACTACITECTKVIEKKAITPFIGQNFKFATHGGKPWTSAEALGRPTALFFGFTDCPSVCPTTLLDMSNALKDLGSRADALAVYFVSVDPERDTVAHLARYLASFDTRIVGLTGDPMETDAMVHAFKAFYVRTPSGDGYTIDHTTSVYLMDRAGVVVDQLRYGARPAEQLAKLRKLIGDSAS